VLGHGIGIDNRFLPTLHEPALLSSISCIFNSTLIATYKQIATMNQLPQELVDRISSFLSPDDLKNTLLLAHAFRFPAENTLARSGHST
jgi:hypothetical protein